MKGIQWIDIRGDRQKGMTYVALGRKYHMDPWTAKWYTELLQKPEYTLSEPKPTKMEPYEQIVNTLFEQSSTGFLLPPPKNDKISSAFSYNFELMLT